MAGLMEAETDAEEEVGMTNSEASDGKKET